MHLLHLLLLRRPHPRRAMLHHSTSRVFLKAAIVETSIGRGDGYTAGTTTCTTWTKGVGMVMVVQGAFREGHLRHAGEAVGGVEAGVKGGCKGWGATTGG